VSCRLAPLFSPLPGQTKHTPHILTSALEPSSSPSKGKGLNESSSKIPPRSLQCLRRRAKISDSFEFPCFRHSNHNLRVRPCVYSAGVGLSGASSEACFFCFCFQATEAPLSRSKQERQTTLQTEMGLGLLGVRGVRGGRKGSMASKLRSTMNEEGLARCHCQVGCCTVSPAWGNGKVGRGRDCTFDGRENSETVEQEEEQACVDPM